VSCFFFNIPDIFSLFLPFSFFPDDSSNSTASVPNRHLFRNLLLSIFLHLSRGNIFFSNPRNKKRERRIIFARVYICFHFFEVDFFLTLLFMASTIPGSLVDFGKQWEGMQGLSPAAEQSVFFSSSYSQMNSDMIPRPVIRNWCAANRK